MKQKQTAIEWLEEELAKNLKHIIQNADSDLIESLFEQAKQMEKEQIFDAYSWGECNIDNYGCKIEKNGAEQYYNETYGGEE